MKPSTDPHQGPAAIRALFDIGSNALKLVLCRVESSTLTTLLDTERITRLGRNSLRTGRLTAADGETLLQAMAELHDEAQRFQPNSFDAYATAALRTCSNPEIIAEPLHRRFGIRLNILNGNEEAAAAFLACRAEVKPGQPVAILDLGGGSTELACGSGLLPTTTLSLPFGARSLLHAHPISDPPTTTELKAIRDGVRERLTDLKPVSEETRLVLIGGAATTLAGYANTSLAPHSSLNGWGLSLAQLRQLVELLAARTQAERRQLFPADQADRSDLILHAAITLEELLRKLHMETATVSTRGLPHGLLTAEMHGLALDTKVPPITLQAIDFPPLNRTDRRGEVLFALRRPDGRFLLQTKQDYPSGLYRLPGGGVNRNEESIQAVIREIYEETGFAGLRPMPIARLRYLAPDNRELEWYSDLFLADLTDDHEPHPVDDKEGITGWRAATQEEIAEQAGQLESLQGELQGWGNFRAAAMRYLVQRIREGRFGT